MNTDWLQKNIVSITIALIGIISTYAIYGYRIAQLEAEASEVETNMAVIHQILQNVAVINTKVENITDDVAEIKTDVKDLNEKIEEI